MFTGETSFSSELRAPKLPSFLVCDAWPTAAGCNEYSNGGRFQKYDGNS